MNSSRPTVDVIIPTVESGKGKNVRLPGRTGDNNEKSAYRADGLTISQACSCEFGSGPSWTMRATRSLSTRQGQQVRMYVSLVSLLCSKTQRLFITVLCLWIRFKFETLHLQSINNQSMGLGISFPQRLSLDASDAIPYIELSEDAWLVCVPWRTVSRRHRK